MRKVKLKGNLEWIKPADKHLNGVQWVDDTNGQYEIIRFEYNWFEKILIRFNLMKDTKRYFIGFDPFKPEKQCPQH